MAWRSRRFRASWLIAILRQLSLLLIGTTCLLAFSGCATHCCPETVSAPPESRFVKTSIQLPSGEPCPTWRTRSPGRTILLLHALNGISPELLRFSLEMERWGYRIYIPSLYGDVINGEPVYGYDMAVAAARFLQKSERWEVYDLETGPGPILDDVRAMTREIGRREGGNLIVIGNCLTGSFPLALLDEPSVRVAVLAQPAMPLMRAHHVAGFPQWPKSRRAVGIKDDELDRGLAALAAHPGKSVLGFHYREDPLAPIVKFDTIRRRIEDVGAGDRFTAYVLERKPRFYSRLRSEWVVADVTESRKKFLEPHSTIVNAASESDRQWFRTRLREALAETR